MLGTLCCNYAPLDSTERRKSSLNPTMIIVASFGAIGTKLFRKKYKIVLRES